MSATAGDDAEEVPVAKGKKVRCRQCGAKNDDGVDRCRICTGMLTSNLTSSMPAEREATAAAADAGTFQPEDLWSSPAAEAVDDAPPPVPPGPPPAPPPPPEPDAPFEVPTSGVDAGAGMAAAPVDPGPDEPFDPDALWATPGDELAVEEPEASTPPPAPGPPPAPPAAPGPPPAAPPPPPPPPPG